MSVQYDASIKYIQSSGSQWINTGVTVTNTDKLVVTYHNVTPLTSGTARYLQGFNSSSWAYWGVKNGYYEFGGAFNTVAIGENDTCVWTRNGGGQYASLTVNGQIVNETLSANTTTASELQLFALLSIYRDGSWRIGEVVVNLNDVIVRDFIPVRIGALGYMYDKVTNRIFGNNGSGTFICGSDVAPVIKLFSYGQNKFGKIAQSLVN